MVMRETDKHYLLSLLYGAGIILFWRGIWEASDTLPLIRNPYVSFFVGLSIITFTGVIYWQFDPLGNKMSRTLRYMHDLLQETKRGEKYLLHYFDNVTKKHHIIRAETVHHIEHHYLVTREQGKEKFYPLHRITHIKKNGKVVWRQ